MKIEDYIKGKVKYDGYGTMIWDEKNNHLADIRGWGSIQNMFDTEQECTDFQDKIGQFIVDAINEKLNR